MGSFPLLGLDRAAWDIENEYDLVALNARQAPDCFSRWFTNRVVPIYHEVIGEKFKVLLRRMHYGLMITMISVSYQQNSALVYTNMTNRP